MDNNKIKSALEELENNSKKRNFKQSYDLIINLKNLDLKKADQQIDFFMQLHYPRYKPVKVCALVGPESVEGAKAADTVIVVDDFEKYKNKKLAKKLAEEHDWFVAQANLMGQIASVFGRVLGPRNKMPNPKAGCVVPPKANLEPLIEKLNKTVRIMAKKDPVIQVMVGKEGMPVEELVDNIHTIYTQVIHHLPGEENNIKSVLIKKTMSKPVRVV